MRCETYILQAKVAKPLPNSLFLPYRNFKEDIKSGKTINEIMEFQFNVIEMVEKCIRRVVSIQESMADLEIPPTVQKRVESTDERFNRRRNYSAAREKDC